MCIKKTVINNFAICNQYIGNNVVHFMTSSQQIKELQLINSFVTLHYYNLKAMDGTFHRMKTTHGGNMQMFEIINHND